MGTSYEEGDAILGTELEGTPKGSPDDKEVWKGRPSSPLRTQRVKKGRKGPN